MNWPPAYTGGSDKMVDALGIAPSSSALQADADLSQLNVQNGEAERTRTVIVFIDNEVHTPFCHGPEKWLSVVGGQSSEVRNTRFRITDDRPPATVFCGYSVVKYQKKERLRLVSP